MIYLSVISAFLNTLTSIILGVVVFARKPKNMQSLTFGCMSTLVSLWSLCYIFWLFSSSEPEALVFCQWLSAFAILIPVTYFHFVLAFLGHRLGKELWYGYAVAGILSLLSFTPLIVQGVREVPWYKYWPTPGGLYWFYVSFYGYYFVRMLWMLWVSYRKEDFVRRNQVLYVLGYSAMGFLGGATNFALWYDIPIPPMGNFCVSIYMIGVGYAVAKYRLLDFSLVAARQLAYIVFVAFGALLYIPFVDLLNRVAPESGGSDFNLYVLSYFIVGSVFLLSPMVKKWLDSQMDRLFSGDLVQGRVVLHQLALGFGGIQSVDEAANHLANTICGSADVRFVGVSLASGHLTDYGLVAATPGTKSFPLEEWLKDSRLYRELCENKQVAVLAEMMLTATGSELKLYRIIQSEYGIEILVPIYSDNHLWGCIAIGRRNSETVFSDVDLSLFASIGLQFGLYLCTKDLERKSSQNENLISLGVVAAGIAHEVRNPMVSIRTFSEMLDENAWDESFRTEFKSVVMRDISRIESIVENVSLFAKGSDVPFSEINIYEAIDRAKEILKDEFSLMSVGIKAPSVDYCMIKGNFDQMVQVFVNLMQNALHATKGQAAPEVIVEVSEYTDSSSQMPFVRISVADNGSGVDPEVRDRIFEPFVTTKSTGDRMRKAGMGLGLALVKRIILAHAGDVYLTSELGVGTVFYIKLPCLKYESYSSRIT